MKNLIKFAGAALVAATMLFTTSCTQDLCVKNKITCQNGGTCLDGICTCAAGYEGDLCATESRTKFVGTFSGNETCTVGSDTYSITIGNSGDVAKVVVTNLYNNTPAYVTPVNLNGTKFTAASVVVSTTPNTVTISDIAGTISGSSLTVSYKISSSAVGSATNACTFTGTKQ